MLALAYLVSSRKLARDEKLLSEIKDPLFQEMTSNVKESFD